MGNRLKRFLSIVLLCSVLFGFGGIGAAGAVETVVSVHADAVTAQAGDHFEIPIRMIGGQGIMGFSMTFTYDDTAMKPLSVLPDTGFGGGWENSIETATDNSFTVVWCGTEEAPAQGIVCTLVFEAKTHAAGDYSIQVTYDQASTFNEAWQDVVLHTEPIPVHIENAHPSPEFVIADSTVGAGETYVCNVMVRNNTGIDVASFTLSYDASVLEPSRVQNGIGTVLSSNLTGMSGMVQVILNQVSADSGDGVLFSICFSTSAHRKGKFPLTLTNSADYICKNGSVTLTSTSPTGSPVVDVQQDVHITNNTITVPIHISGNTGLMGMRLRMSLDSSKFDLNSCTKGDVLQNVSGGLFDYTFNSATGHLEVLWTSSENVYAEGVWCILQIRIKDAAADVLSLGIDYASEDTFDEQLNNVSVTCENAEIPLHRLVINADSFCIHAGETMQLSAMMLYAENQPETLIWQSGDSTAASVDQMGLVRGIQRGVVNITVDDGSGHTATVSVQILPNQPELQLFSYDGSFDRKIDWWTRYAAAGMKLGFIAYKCDEAVRFVWSSNSNRVHIDQQGNITNTGWFARKATLTLTAYDAENNVITESSVTVRLYKFNWQMRQLRTQSAVSNSILFSPQAEEILEAKPEGPETVFSFLWDWILGRFILKT